jgi:hypothetical protein
MIYKEKGPKGPFLHDGMSSWMSRNELQVRKNVGSQWARAATVFFEGCSGETGSSVA